MSCHLRNPFETKNREEEMVNRIQGLVRAASSKKAKEQGWFQDDVVIESLPPDDSLVHGHWLSFVLLWGDSASIVFSVHFSVASAATVLCLGDKASPADVKDAMKEYCNLTGGYIRSVFDRAGVPLGISLPIVSAGFDHVWFRGLLGRHSSLDGWTLSDGARRVVCTSDVTLTRPECAPLIMRALDEIEELEREELRTGTKMTGSIEIL